MCQRHPGAPHQPAHAKPLPAGRRATSAWMTANRPAAWMTAKECEDILSLRALKGKEDRGAMFTERRLTNLHTKE